MAISLPGPVISLTSVTDGGATVHFDSDPAGVTATERRLVWGVVDSTMTLSAAADPSRNVILTGVTEDVFIVAVGYVYDAGGDEHGPSNPIIFTVPYNVFPNLTADNDAMQKIVNQLTNKVTHNDFLHYSALLDARVADLEAQEKAIEVKQIELLRNITALLQS